MLRAGRTDLVGGGSGTGGVLDVEGAKGERGGTWRVCMGGLRTVGVLAVVARSVRDGDATGRWGRGVRRGRGRVLWSMVIEVGEGGWGGGAGEMVGRMRVCVHGGGSSSSERVAVVVVEGRR